MADDASFPPVVDLMRWTEGSRAERLAVARQVASEVLVPGMRSAAPYGSPTARYCAGDRPTPTKTSH